MKGVWRILLGPLCLTQLGLIIFLVLYAARKFAKSASGGQGDIIWAVLIPFIGLSVLLPLFTGKIILNNFPDKIIEGKQKRNSRIISFVSVLLIPIMVVFLVRVFYQTPTFENIRKMRFPTMKFFSALELLLSVAVLIFHIVILLGLYRLKKNIDSTARNNQLGFEKENI